MRRSWFGMRYLAAAPAAAVVLGLAAYGAVALVDRQAGSTYAQGSEPCTPPPVPREAAFLAGPETTFESGFDRSTEVDNQWLPLRPGTQLVYSGRTEEGGEVLTHQVVTTVTDFTKMIDGVRNVVVLELDYSQGQLEEAELAFFAQANDGTVWHFGQYPESYEGGRLVEAPAWIHGIEGAHAGIAMKAEPKLGAGSYSQGWGPAVGWVDRAIVHDLHRQVCVRAGCYDDVLVMDEFGLDAPGAHQLKYYAPGIGNVRVGWYGDDDTQESLELVRVIQLNPAQLAAVRAHAQRLERNAYKISKNVYGRTSPMVIAS